MKRALLLALVLANLGVFAWYRWYVLPGETHPALAPPLGGEPLKLTSELTEAQRKTLAAAPAPSTAAPPPAATQPAPAPSTAAVAAAQACATYGPFADEDSVQQAESRLKQLNLTATEHTVTGKAKPGYWVYLPPFGSKKEADAAVALMKKRGVSDIYVVSDEANRNAISLGLFNQHEYAVQRIKELKKLGYHPQVTERFREEPRYWIDAKGPPASLPAADFFKDLGDDSNPIGRGTGVCSGG
ncbi:MAG: SPOR domain-containing protein [Bacillota bacterium]